MKIVLLGTGNVAHVLGKKAKLAGHQIIQVYGRNAQAASTLAYELDTDSTDYLSIIKTDADLYLFCVADTALASLAAHLSFPGKVVAHTAAAVPKEVLASVSQHYGVFYPLQSLRKERPEPGMLPLYFEASDETAEQLLKELANSISPLPASAANQQERLKLHIAAVFVSNFVNHLYVLAKDYCAREGLDFSRLLPLIEETALRIKNGDPGDLQTGPAVRNDQATIEQHLAILKAYPDMERLYRSLTQSIQIYHKGNSFAEPESKS